MNLYDKNQYIDSVVTILSALAINHLIGLVWFKY